MRTALILLLLLASGAVIGSLLPQIPNSPTRVGRYLNDHEFWGTLFLRAGFFDVYGSWWFVLITTLLFVSLGACLLPRTRATLRALRQPPVQARELDAFPQHAEVGRSLEPEAAAAEAERLLRRRGFRVRRDGAAVAAEKGLLRETGSLLFHWAFVLLLAGVILGKGTGFSGFAVVTEGETWVDARPNYDGRIRVGRYFGEAFTGTQIELLDFEATFRSNGVPLDFVSRVRVRDRDGRSLGTREIRVNHPASVDGLRLFQSGYGFAPVLTAELADDRLWSSPIDMRRDEPPPGIPADAMPWRGAIKVTTTEPDLMVTLELWPDFRAWVALQLTGRPTSMLVPFDPYVRFSVYEGTIADPARATLDTTGLRRVARGDLRAAGTATVMAPGVGELTLAFPELRQYSELQVSRDVGIPIVVVAAILVLVGLIPALYVSRRKIWVRARPVSGGSRVTVAGFALQRKDAFSEEFERIVRSIERDVGERSNAESVGAP